MDEQSAPGQTNRERSPIESRSKDREHDRETETLSEQPGILLARNIKDNKKGFNTYISDKKEG